MSKPELSEERIEAVRSRCVVDRKMTLANSPMRQRAETTLALIESRKQALELLKETFGEIKVAGSMSIGLFERISNYLDKNQ